MKTLLLATILTLLLPFGSQAATVGGIQLPKTRGELQLQGAGLLRKGMIFKIYVGALYVQDEKHVHDILSNVPKRIDIHYFHHTPKKYMVRAADASLKQNLSEEQYVEFLPEIEKLHNAYLNGKKDSFASLILTPGEGLTYCYDNKPVLTINCDEFANAYFAIWLGEEPSSKTIKKGMLNHD